MEIVIGDRSKLKAKIFGRDLELSRPTVGQIEKMESELAEPGAKPISVMKRFVGELGLPADVCSQLDLGQFQYLIEELSAPKKK